jgi:hypothetical protein
MRIPLPPLASVQLLLVGLFVGIAGGCTRSSADDAEGRPLPRPASLERRVTVPATAAPSHGGGWPAWRGPTGDGISGETDWSSDWPADGPKKRWMAQVGVGFSAVSVANGRAYTAGHAATEHDGEKETAGEALVSVQANRQQP